MMEIRIVGRKYAQSILTSLRDKTLSQIEFRKGLVRLGRIIGLEIVEDFETEPIEVETPLGVRVRGVRIRDLDNVVIVTVLRAAWPLTEGLVKIFYKAKMGVIVAKRLEEKGLINGGFDIEVFYSRMPEISSEDVVIISDVMVATGSTIIAVLNKLLEKQRARRYYLACVLITPHAISRIKKLVDEKNIDLRIYAVAVDPEINDKGYIVPGLGDAGDRAFGS